MPTIRTGNSFWSLASPRSPRRRQEVNKDNVEDENYKTSPRQFCLARRAACSIGKRSELHKSPDRSDHDLTESQFWRRNDTQNSPPVPTLLLASAKRPRSCEARLQLYKTRPPAHPLLLEDRTHNKIRLLHRKIKPSFLFSTPEKIKLLEIIQ